MEIDEKDPFASLEAFAKAMEEKFGESKVARATPSEADDAYAKERQRNVDKRKAQAMDLFVERSRIQNESISVKNEDQRSTTKLRMGFCWVAMSFLIVSATFVLAAIGYDSFFTEEKSLDPIIVSAVFSGLIAGLIGLVHIVAKGLFKSNTEERDP